MSNFSDKTRRITILGLLVAIEIILSRFLSINAWNMKIGLSFVPVVITAMLYGPVNAGIVAALGDFLGAVLFPIGPYFPGFTVTAFLTGLVFGLLLHQKQGIVRIAASVVVVQVFGSLLLNSLWISILYGSPFGPLLVTRAVQCVINGTVQMLVILALPPVVHRVKRLAAA